MERAATLMTAETLAELDELAARFAEAVRAGDARASRTSNSSSTGR